MSNSANPGMNGSFNYTYQGNLAPGSVAYDAMISAKARAEQGIQDMRQTFPGLEQILKKGMYNNIKWSNKMRAENSPWGFTDDCAKQDKSDKGKPDFYISALGDTNGGPQSTENPRHTMVHELMHGIDDMLGEGLNAALQPQNDPVVRKADHVSTGTLTILALPALQGACRRFVDVDASDLVA